MKSDTTAVKVGSRGFPVQDGFVPSIRKFISAIFVAGAAAAVLAAPAVEGFSPAPQPANVLADPGVVGNGGPDGDGGGGGCGSGPGWQGCGGWNPGEGGFGQGCINGICGGWDGNRGWTG